MNDFLEKNFDINEVHIKMVPDHFTAHCEMTFAVISLQFAVIDLQFAVISLQFAVISLQFAVISLQFAVIGLQNVHLL